MDISTLMLVRTLHILLAALWLGAALLLTVFLMPAMRQAGTDGAPVMARLVQRRLGPYMGAVAGLTVLTGLWLYWRVTNGLAVAVMTSTPVLVLGIGALAGLVAMVLGGAILGRGTVIMAKTLAEASRLPAGAERDGRLERLAHLQRRFALFSRIVVVLLIAALLCMTLSHLL